MKNKFKKIHPYLLFISIIISLFFVNFTLRRIDGDILWHYKLGEEILNAHAISMEDTFSWQKGLIWVQQEWLYDLILYGIIALGQMPAFIILAFINRILFFYGGAFFSGAKSRLFYLLYAASLLLIVPTNFGNRPSEFSAWLVILAVWLWRNLKNHGLWYWIPFAVFVSNFHGGSNMTLLILLVILAFIDTIYDIRSQGKKGFKGIWKHFIPFPVYIAASLINPSFTKMWEISLGLHHYESTAYIQEWAPWSLNYFSAFLVLLLVLALGFECKKSAFSKQAVQDTAVICALLVASMVSQKAATILLPVWAIYGYRYTEQFIMAFLHHFKITVKTINWSPSVIAAAICTIILSVSIVSVYPYRGAFQEYADQDNPEEIISYLENLPAGTRILNGYGDGSKLLYHNIQVFIDPRQFPYAKESGNGSLDDYLETVFENSKDLDMWRDFLNKYDFEYILTSPTQLNTDWCLKIIGGWDMLLHDEDTGMSLWGRQTPDGITLHAKNRKKDFT